MGSVATLDNQMKKTDQSPVSLLSAGMLAKRLGFSTRTIWRLTSAGKIPQPLKIGGSVRWRADEIDAWIYAGCPDMDTWDTDRLRSTSPSWRSRSTRE